MLIAIPRVRLLKFALLAFLGIQAMVFIVVSILRQDSSLNRFRNTATDSHSAANNDSLEAFLAMYEEYCERFLTPRPKNIAEFEKLVKSNKSHELCPCIPDTLVGNLNLTFDPYTIGELELRHQELDAGGSWSPRHCMPRHRVAVVIPFRDREEHLRILLSILHSILQRQLIQYTVFVIEQLEPLVFNKASLMNVGFMESQMFAEFDCVIFHDVDMLPENDHNFYVCSSDPRHVGSHLSKWNYEIPYPGLFGGVTAFRPEHFVKTNGFSNQYYGWGGEDDDMYNRIKAQNMTFSRFSKAVARYSMIKHSSDARNPYNTKSDIAWKVRPTHYAVDGLNSLRYSIKAHEVRPLYTWILVSLPPHPSYLRVVFDGRSRDANYDGDVYAARQKAFLISLPIAFVIFLVYSLVFVHRARCSYVSMAQCVVDMVYS